MYYRNVILINKCYFHTVRSGIKSKEKQHEINTRSKLFQHKFNTKTSPD